MVNQFWGEWAQRGLRVLAACALVLLAACGSSSKYEEFIPTRIVSVGDQLSYMGNSALTPAFSDRFTINNTATDTGINNWVLQLASSYGLSINLTAADPAVVARTDATANRVSDLAARLTGVTARAGDMLVVNGGMADILALADAVADNPTATAQALKDIAAAGASLQDLLTAQQNNFKHILVLNAYDLRYSPYASSKTLNSYAGGFSQFLHDMTRAFNNGLIRNAGTFPAGSGIRLFDLETLFLNANLYNFGITIAGLSSSTCPSFTTEASRTACTTTAASAIHSDFATYLFADTRFPTPLAHQLLGSQVYTFLRGVKGW